MATLEIRLSDGAVHLLDPRNRECIEGTAPPLLGGSNPLLTWAGRIGMLLFGGLLVALLAVTGWMLAWNSSLADVTRATVDRVAGDEVVYTYEVAGQRITKTERSSRGSVLGQEGELTDVRYISMAPRWSMLEANNEQVDWFTFVGATLFLAALIYAGWSMVRESQRLQRLAERATHVLPATIVLEIPGPKGSRTYVYEIETPAGKTVRGNVPVGAAIRLPVPSQAAALYADDRTHALL